MLTLELGEDKAPTVCDCCGGVCRSAYGFVYRDGDAYAIYWAVWSEPHAEAGVAVVMEFDDSGEWEGLESRYSVGFRAWATMGEYQLVFQNPEESAWGATENRGAMLSREEALAHRNKDAFLHVAQHILIDDPRVRAALDLGAPSS